MVGCFPLILAWFGNALFGQYRHRRCRHVQAGWGSDSDCDTDSDTDTDTDSDTENKGPGDASSMRLPAFCLGYCSRLALAVHPAG